MVVKQAIFLQIPWQYYVLSYWKLFKILDCKALGKWSGWLVFSCFHLHNNLKSSVDSLECRDLRRRMMAFGVYTGHLNSFSVHANISKYVLQLAQPGLSLFCVLQGSIMGDWIALKRRVFWIIIQHFFFIFIFG